MRFLSWNVAQLRAKLELEKLKSEGWVNAPFCGVRCEKKQRDGSPHNRRCIRPLENHNVLQIIRGFLRSIWKNSLLISRPFQILLNHTTITAINGLNKFILGTYLPVIKTYRTIILPVVLCGCENWFLTLSKEHRMRVFENRMVYLMTLRLFKTTEQGE